MATMTWSAEDVNLKAEEAVDAAEQFHKLYYEKYDQNRQNLAKLFYLDSSVLIWDGNLVKGAADIQAFLDKLPTSVTEICSLDAQPILYGSETSIVVATAGKIKYYGNTERLFHQNFVLTAVNSTWKIASDTIRLAE